VTDDRSPELKREPDPKARTRPLDARDVGGLDTGSAAPEAITEQPEFPFEHDPMAKWIGALGSIRFATLVIAKRKRVARGEYVPPTPWLGIAIFCGLAAALIAVTVLLVRLLPG